MKIRKERATRTETVTIRTTPEILAAAQLVAQATGRTVSSLTEYALKRFIEKNHPNAFDPRARIAIQIDDAPEDEE